MRAREFITEKRPPRKFSDYTRQERQINAKQQRRLAKIDAQYPYESPVKDWRLIRVQDGFWGIEPKPDGTVALNKKGQVRKTIHFTINGSVSSHAFGNWDNSGVVIIADPKQIRAQPSSVGFADTWYHVDRNDELNIGRPIILAPTGLQVPQGLKVTTYSGDREEALNKTLESLGIKPLAINAHGANFSDVYDKNVNTRPGAPFDVRDQFSGIDPNRELDIMKQKSGIHPSLSSRKHYYTKDASYERAVSAARKAAQIIKTNGITKREGQKDWVVSFPRKLSSGDMTEYSIDIKNEVLNGLENALSHFKSDLATDKQSPTWNQDMYIYYARAIKEMRELYELFTKWYQVWSGLQPGQTVPAPTT